MYYVTFKLTLCAQREQQHWKMSATAHKKETERFLSERLSNYSADRWLYFFFSKYFMPSFPLTMVSFVRRVSCVRLTLDTFYRVYFIRGSYCCMYCCIGEFLFSIYRIIWTKWVETQLLSHLRMFSSRGVCTNKLGFFLPNRAERLKSGLECSSTMQ